MNQRLRLHSSRPSKDRIPRVWRGFLCCRELWQEAAHVAGAAGSALIGGAFGGVGAFGVKVTNAGKTIAARGDEIRAAAAGLGRLRRAGAFVSGYPRQVSGRGLVGIGRTVSRGNFVGLASCEVFCG